MALIETAKFPATLVTEADLQNHKNLTPSATVPTLSASITNTATSIVLAAGTGSSLPLDNFTVSIDDEIMFVNSRSTDTLTVGQRGYEGTTTAAHNAGAQVWPRITAKAHNQMVSEMVALQAALGANLRNVEQVIYADATAVTVSGAVTTDQNMKSSTALGAAFMNRVGKTLRVRAGGTYSCQATAPTFFMKVIFASVATLVSSQTLTLVSSTSAQKWYIDATIMCTGTGTSGTMRNSGLFVFNKQGSAGSPFVDADDRGVNTDLTANLTVTTVATFPTNASSSNSVTQDYLILTCRG